MLFYLGPVGRLFALPEIEHDIEPDATGESPGSIFTSATGARSQERTGPSRRTWDLEWKYFTRAEFDILDALRRGHLGGPLRLLDPSLPNLANAQIATGGTEQRSVYGWSTVAGSRKWVRPSSIPLDLLAVGAIEWTKATAQDDLATGREVPAYRIPAPPEGGPVSVAARMMRVDTPGAVAVTPGVDSWDAAGARSSTFVADQSVTGTWSDQPYALELPAGAVEWAPVWRIGSGVAAALNVAGVRAGFGEVPPAPDRGGGAPVVLITELPQSYPSQDEFSFAATLVES